MKTSFLVALLIAASVMATPDQELYAGITEAQTPIPNANAFVQACNTHWQFLRSNVDRSQLDAEAAKITTVIAGFPLGVIPQPKKLHESLVELKFGTHLTNVNSEESIQPFPFTSSVLFKAIAGDRVGEQVQATIGEAIYFCMSKPLYAEQRTWVCNSDPSGQKCDWKVTQIARGLNPQELDIVRNFLKEKAIATLAEKGRTELNLSGRLLSVIENNEAHYIKEGKALKKYFPELESSFAEIDQVSAADLGQAIIELSKKRVTDKDILSRISSLSSSTENSSFLYCPDGDILFAISLAKKGDSLNIRQSKFKAIGKFPAGAFATSTGAWSIERKGEVSTPAFLELSKIFPPLK
jgi:hypothetical protein